MKKASSVARIIAPILILVSICMIFLPWITISALGYTESRSFFDVFESTIDWIGDDGEATFFFFLGIALMLTAVLGIVLSALGLKVGPIPYFVLAVASFISVVVLISDSAGEVMRYLNKSALSLVGIGAWICPFLALIAVVLMFVLKDNAPQQQQRMEPAPVMAPPVYPQQIPTPAPMPAPMPAPAPVQEDLGYTVPVTPAVPSGKMIAVSGTYAGYDFEIKDGEQIVIGKDANVAQVVIDPSYKQVSRKHVGISFDAARDQYRVTDYSSNGTLIDGQKMDSGRTVYVRRGTIVSLADEKNAFRLS